MYPSILTIGLNHATAPISIREHVANSSCLREEALDRLYEAMRAAGMLESLVLSTCNRTELYAVAEGRDHAEQTLRNLFAAQAAFPLDHPEYLYAFAERDAVAHLFAVASGIDSMVVGEFEILGQVRQAYLQAIDKKAIGPVLHRLFKDAIHVGKRAHSETLIGAGAVSVAYAAVSLARQRLGSLRGRRVLIIGAGEMGRRAAKSVSKDGASTVMVTNRTFAQAAELAAETGGCAISFDELATALVDADVVISATSAPHIILDAATVARALERRPDRPLYLFDIAVPRDIEPEAATLAGACLYNIDDLKQHIDENRAIREKAVVEVRGIIDKEAERFWLWHLQRRAAPVLADLSAHAETIRTAELDKAFRRLTHLRLSERDRNVIAALSAGIVSKLLAAPTAHLKERVQSGDGQVYLDAVRELFELDTDEYTKLPPSL